MGKRKRIITFTVGVLIAVAIAAGLFYYFSLAPSRKPLPREVRKEQPLLSKIETVAKKKVTTAQPEEQKLPISGEQPEVKERKEPRREIAQPEYAYAYLAAEPKALSIEVEQGQRQQASFKLTNKGRKAAWLNLYKSELNEPPVAFGEKIEQYLTHKKEVIADKDPVAMLAKAGLSFGAPGIIIYPTYNVIESGQSQEIRLTVDARDLEADKEYTAQILALGMEERESLLLPLYIKVRPAPKIEFVKIEVDDGTASGTQGNGNNIANPGETVAFSLYFENSGNAPAKNLSLAISFKEPGVEILTDPVVRRPYLYPKELFSEKFIIRLPATAHPKIPPVVDVKIQDGAGRVWQEDIYVGAPDKIEYPMGVILEPQDKQVQITQGIEQRGGGQ